MRARSANAAAPTESKISYAAAELIAGVAPAPLAAQALAVDQMGAGQIHPQAGTAEAVDRLTVQGARRPAPSLSSARERASAPSTQSVPQARAVPESRCSGADRGLWYRTAHRRLNQLDQRPAGEPDRSRVLARPLRRG